MADKDLQLAQVKLPPAVIVIGLFLVSVVASVLERNTWQHRLAPGLLTVLGYIGIALEVLGVVVLLISYGSFAKAKTTILPSEHSAKLVTTGLHAFSRNPIYLGWFTFILGLGIRHATVLVLVIDVIMIVLLYWAVVLKEEEYLANKFGEEYLSYKRRVRRWL
jgi:protein-S-isoprenylcysteine O-methyltransferase Ste14